MLFVGGIAAMKNLRTTVMLVGLGASAVGQGSKKTDAAKPNLSASFAETGLKALQAIGDFKGTGSLTGPAKDALEDTRVEARSTSAPETLMVAHLLDLAIMRSTDNFARQNVLVKATAKLEHQGVQPTRQAVLEKVQKDPELSAALDAINKRESECSAALEKAFRDRIAITLPGACASR
jgi:hypothetical protein